MKQVAQHRAQENLQARTYTSELALDLFLGEAETDRARAFIDRVQANHCYDTEFGEKELQLISTTLRTVCDDLFHFRHTDQTGLEMVHGDWLQKLQEGDMLWVGAQWWENPGTGQTGGGGHAVYFVRYDISSDTIYTVDDLAELAKNTPYLDQFDAKTLHRKNCSKYKLFAENPSTVKKLCAGEDT